MANVVTIVVAIISSGLLTTLISRAFTVSDRKRDAKTGQVAALRLMMKDRLRFLCRHYIEQGWIYADERADIIEMHKCYHDTLHGNGWLDEMMEIVKDLEVRGVSH